MNKKILVGAVILLGFILVISTLDGLADVPGMPTPTPNPHPTSVAPRQGVSSGNYGATNSYISEMSQWVYIHLDAWNGTYPTDHEFVPMLFWGIDLPDGDDVEEIDNKTNHDYWLVFNECEIVGQCDTSPEIMAARYLNEVLPFIQIHDIDAQLIIGGSMAHECGLTWISRFVDEYRNLTGGEDPPRAGWHFHIYPDIAPDSDEWQPGQLCPNSWNPEGLRSADVNQFIDDANRIRRWLAQYGSPDDEVWITETGCLVGVACPPNKGHANMVDYMAAVTSYLNDDEGRWIDRYAWFTDVTGGFPITHLYLQVNPTPQIPSDIGTYYSQVEPSDHIAEFLYFSNLPVLTNDSSANIENPTPAVPPSGYPPPPSSSGYPPP